MSRLSKEQVHAIAEMAQLEIQEEEAEKVAGELDRLLEMVDSLQELNTNNVEPTTHVFMLENVLREDVAQEGLPREEILKNVPEHEDGQIKVPTILE